MLKSWGNRIDTATAAADPTVDRLSDDLPTSPTAPSRGVAFWLASLIAVLTHLLTVAIAVGGVVLLLTGSFVGIILGVALLGLAVLMRPRLGGMPAEAIVLEPADAPELYRLVHAVASALGGPPVWRIVLVERVNAAYARIGVRRRPVLALGYPLWNLLDERQRVALLGHEMGHAVNNDVRRGLLVGSAVDALLELHAVLRTPSPGDGGLVMMVASWVTGLLGWLVSLPVRGLLVVQHRLVMRMSRQAEFYADHLAAVVAGKDATVAMLDTVALADVATAALHMAVMRREQDIWAAHRAWLDNRTDADRQRFDEAESLRPHHVDASHPPTRLRVAAVRARSYPDVVPPAADHAAVDRELQPALPVLARRVRDEAIS